jgi:hypothetical protein
MNLKNDHSSKTEDYSNIITIFSVLLLIEYTNETYDVWDLFLGFVILLIGYKLKDNKEISSDRLYQFLFNSIIALGVFEIMNSLLAFSFWLCPTFKKCLLERFLPFDSLSFLRFLFFLILILIAYFGAWIKKMS